MKKFFKALLCLSIITIFGIKGAEVVYADIGDHVTITKYEIENVWGYHYKNGEMWGYVNLPFRYADGKLVYCIEPDIKITTYDYITYDFNRSGYSEETRKQMELISYYGYKYDGHDSLKYYIATQDLLWRFFGYTDDIRWTTGGEYGEEIDISTEKNEILNLISKHNVLPTFNNSVNEVNVNESIELIDNNYMLSNYDIEYSSDIEVIKDNNKLIITPKKQGEYIINFIHKKNYDFNTYLYDNFNTSTQSLAIFGAPELINGSIKILSNKIEVDFNKKDEETKELITDLGNKIKIKNLDDNTYTDIFEFNDGKLSLSLKEGNYLIEEVSSSNSYSINEGLEFSISKDDTYKEIDFFNKKVKCEITVFSISGDIKLDSDFEVYDLEGNLIYKGRTTNGEERIELEYGNYIIKEISVPSGYKLDENEISLEVNDKSCTSRVTFNNDKVIMPVTSKESSLVYFIILFLDLIGYVFVKKNS
jgi:hypothetical protein